MANKCEINKTHMYLVLTMKKKNFKKIEVEMEEDGTIPEIRLKII